MPPLPWPGQHSHPVSRCVLTVGELLQVWGSDLDVEASPGAVGGLPAPQLWATTNYCAGLVTAAVGRADWWLLVLCLSKQFPVWAAVLPLHAGGSQKLIP